MPKNGDSVFWNDIGSPFIELSVDMSDKKSLIKGTECDPIGRHHMVNEKM
jgi:hypothetical protein